MKYSLMLVSLSCRGHISAVFTNCDVYYQKNHKELASESLSRILYFLNTHQIVGCIAHMNQEQ